MGKLTIGLGKKTDADGNNMARVGIGWSSVEESFRSKKMGDVFESFDVTLFKDDQELVTNKFRMNHEPAYEPELKKAEATSYWFHRNEPISTGAWVRGKYLDKEMNPNKVVIKAKNVDGYEFTTEEAFDWDEVNTIK